MHKRMLMSVVVAMLVAGMGLAGCEKGPLQKAGEKQDKAIGKGPSEKAGRKIDNTVNDIKK